MGHGRAHIGVRAMPHEVRAFHESRRRERRAGAAVRIEREGSALEGQPKSPPKPGALTLALIGRLAELDPENMRVSNSRD